MFHSPLASPAWIGLRAADCLTVTGNNRFLAECVKRRSPRGTHNQITVCIYRKCPFVFAHLLTECGCQSLADACRHISSVQFVFKQCLLARNSSLRSANTHLLTKMVFRGTPRRANAPPAGSGRHCRDRFCTVRRNCFFFFFLFLFFGLFFFSAPPVLK